VPSLGDTMGTLSAQSQPGGSGYFEDYGLYGGIVLLTVLLCVLGMCILLCRKRRSQKRIARWKNSAKSKSDGESQPKAKAKALSKTTSYHAVDIMDAAESESDSDELYRPSHCATEGSDVALDALPNAGAHLEEGSLPGTVNVQLGVWAEADDVDIVETINETQLGDIPFQGGDQPHHGIQMPQ